MEEMMQDSYIAVCGCAEGLYKDRGSRFLARVRPVESAVEVSDIVAALRKEEHDARHHCYAYRLGLGGGEFRASDDGEPSGSAGRPILGQIDSAGLSDTLVVVTRWFGGTRLGIPGLIKAYKSAAAEALAAAPKEAKVAGEWFRIGFPYASMNEVMRLVKDMDLPQRAQAYAADCSLEVRVRLSAEASFRGAVGRMDGVVVELLKNNNQKPCR